MRLVSRSSPVFVRGLGIGLVGGLALAACTSITGADKLTIGGGIDGIPDTTNAEPDVRTGDSETGAPNEASSPPSDGSTSDAFDASVQDSGSDASDGALPPPASDPNAINPCGPPDGPRCEEGYACCATYPATAPSCILRVYSCNPGAGDTRLAHLFCDEKADCSGTQSCCFMPTGGSSFTAKCQTSCTPKMCRTDAECGDDKCIRWPCANGPVVATCNGDGFDSTYCY